MDFTFTAPKSVSLAREMGGAENEGDERVETAHREAVAYTVGIIEADMKTRVRVGGANHNRVTGNLMAYRVTHRDSRINPDDQMPDPHMHDHVFVLNTTFDPVEGKWKAAQIGDIKHDAPYYEAIYENRLACNLRELGYGVRRAGKAFEVEGIERDLIDKYSRRHAYIAAETERRAEILGIPEHGKRMEGLKAVMGAKTRLGKTKETAEDLNSYYVSRLTDDERETVSTLQGRPSYESSPDKGIKYAIAHLFDRDSVVEERKLYEVAIRHAIGSVTPEGIEYAAKVHGVLLKDGQATTREVLEEESRIIQFAREGKGTMRPLVSSSASQPDNPATLSPEQQAIVAHVLRSPDQMTLVIGDAGTGKTTAIKAAFQEIDRPVEMLAPSVDASRGVLRKEGFTNADTVASFLNDEKRQAAIKNGVIWVDEAGLLPIRDLYRLVAICSEQNARIVLQGDPKQHHAVVRHGNMMSVLQEFAGLPVGRLTEVWRQKHKGYKAIVADIAAGKRSEAFDHLRDLGWVKQTDGNAALINDYLDALSTKKPGQSDLDRVMIVAPTHAEGDEITEELRQRLKAERVIGKDEHILKTFRQLAWTPAEKSDPFRYEGTETLYFHRSAGTFKAGQRVRISEWRLGAVLPGPEAFSVFAVDERGFSVGDRIRITGTGKDKSGHRLNNGSHYTIRDFTPEGDITLNNGWVISKDFGFIDHGYVSTSYASQGKSVDRVLIAMGEESLGAINAEQFYVSVSRGKESARVYSNLSPDALKVAIGRTDERKSATELIRPKPPKKRRRKIMGLLKAGYEMLWERMFGDRQERKQEKEQTHER